MKNFLTVSSEPILFHFGLKLFLKKKYFFFWPHFRALTASGGPTKWSHPDLLTPQEAKYLFFLGNMYPETDFHPRNGPLKPAGKAPRIGPPKAPAESATPPNHPNIKIFSTFFF